MAKIEVIKCEHIFLLKCIPQLKSKFVKTDNNGVFLGSIFGHRKPLSQVFKLKKKNKYTPTLLERYLLFFRHKKQLQLFPIYFIWPLPQTQFF